MKSLLPLPSVFLAALASFLIWPVGSPTPPEKVSPTPPVQRLELDAGLSGPTIHALFGRFPGVSANCNENVTPSWSRTVRSAGQNLPLVSGCSTPHCPYGSQPSFGCFTNHTAYPIMTCSYNSSCTNWGCMSSTSGCCNQCAWTQTDCWSCLTNGYCS
jgi:hypothetical protein